MRVQPVRSVGFMPLIWLRVAVACYGVGLLYSLLLLSKQGNVLAKVVEPAVGLGLIFHFVSLVESTILIGHLVAGLDSLFRVDPGLPGDGGLLRLLRRIPHHLARHRDFPDRLYSDICLGDRTEAGYA